MTGLDLEALTEWADTVVPRAESTSSRGDRTRSFVTELSRVLRDDVPGGVERFHALVSRLSARDIESHLTDPDVAWFTRLAGRVYVSEPSTRVDLGWPSPARPRGPSSDIPAEVTASVLPPSRLWGHYDAIVVGSGAGGGVAAQELTGAGRMVLVVERGAMPSTSELRGDHLRNPRADAGVDVATGPPSHDNPRMLADGSVIAPTDPRWGNNAMTFGGGTRVYGAQAWRFAPDDFRMASVYGVPEDSALADWPVSYAEMERYYAHAEFEWGVSGAAGPLGTEGARSGPFPLPPLPRTMAGKRLAAAAGELGWSTVPVPLLLNSEPYRGRPACIRCAECVGFACPVGAKAGSHNTALWKAARTCRVHIVTRAQVVELLATPDGAVTGVLVRGEGDDGIWEARITADEVVLAAGAVETARLLLVSRTAREPHGIGNNHDQVGRHLQAHLYAGALGIFDDVVESGIGPGPAVATNDFRHGGDVVGGGMLANDFVPTPASSLGYLQDAGLMPRTGAELVTRLAELMPRMMRVVGPVHEMTSAHSRVTIAEGVLDSRGMPVARLSGDIHPEDLRVQAMLSERADAWLQAAGARTVVRQALARPGSGPSVGQHQAGTCRMGEDPSRSVVDPVGRVWGHDNVRVVDASVHVTNGGVNPVLTVIANAYRMMAEMTGTERVADGYEDQAPGACRH